MAMLGAWVTILERPTPVCWTLHVHDSSACLLPSIFYASLLYMWADFLYRFHNPLLIYLKGSLFFFSLSLTFSRCNLPPHMSWRFSPLDIKWWLISQSCEKRNIKRDVFVLFQSFYEPLLYSCPISIFLRYESKILSAFPEQPCSVEILVPQSHLENWLRATSHFHGVLWPHFSAAACVFTIFVTFLNAKVFYTGLLLFIFLLKTTSLCFSFLPSVGCSGFTSLWHYV